MKTYRERPTHKRSISGLPGVSILLLLLAGAAHAAPQDIDLTAGCPNNPDYLIEAFVGLPLSLDIGVLNAAGDITLIFDDAPTGTGCGAGPVSYPCANDVTVTLPANPGTEVPSTSVVTVRGVGGTGSDSPTAADSFYFVLEADDGAETCLRRYEVIFPYDIVFVLDRSGSMGWTSNVSSPATNRWDALKRAVVGSGIIMGFTQKIVDEPSSGGSRFGLTHFATTVVANNSFPAGLVAIDATLAASVDTELGSQTPSGWTAMGLGLKNGEAKLTNCNRPRIVVLFTDGEQNQPPQVLGTGTGYDDSTLINITCPSGPQTLEIVTVGIGNPSGGYLTTLQNLATQNGPNQAIITSNGEDFDWSDGSSLGTIGAAFDQALVPALAGNSPQMVASYGGVVRGEPVTLPPFAINRRVSQLFVKVSWSQDFEVPQQTVLGGVKVLKDGADVTSLFERVVVGDFTNFGFLRIDFSAPLLTPISPEGSYSIELSPLAGAADLGYRVVVYADDHHLDMDWQVEPATPQVHQPFSPTVRLAWLGQPLAGADVQAWILKPGEDLGDLLAKDPTTVDVSDDSDAGSPGFQKYRELLENDPDFLAQLAPDEQQPTLAHQGGGVYSAAYDPGDISGLYQVLYRVSAEDLDFGTVQRVAMQSVYVRFDEIDLDASAVSTTVDDNVVNINFRPVRPGGRYFGPANGGAFSVDSAGISLTNVTDHQDGSYTLTLTGDPDAQVSVKILDEEIYQGTASDFGPEEEGLPRWLLWLLILVVLLLVIWLIRRLSGGSGP